MITGIFSDFDGTVSQRDVGYNIFHHFSGGKSDAVLPDWKSGKMSTRDCLTAEAKLVTASADEIRSYIDNFEIDKHFHTFVNKCEGHNYPLTIISDGLSFYIEHILKKNGLSHLKFISNEGHLENNTISVSFPHENKTCSRCGICKGEQLRNFKSEHNNKCRTIFVGDGYSDACAAGEADVLFAKKDLKQYCNDNNITYIPYDDFNDVIIKLTELDIFK